ncbi:MAG: hypothetical protein GOMPHAMPRED_006594 [Gomphillus americanus]|uniref:Uncharacterized protein n=1 Tax=Gomphillus americanus TaxID=1940652 RepID=A0A8H3FYM5_9LECA|nr:MAG: hypothetical protein GOMPHAMPRED_006594 [Gomphillus americanus]
MRSALITFVAFFATALAAPVAPSADATFTKLQSLAQEHPELKSSVENVLIREYKRSLERRDATLVKLQQLAVDHPEIKSDVEHILSYEY